MRAGALQLVLMEELGLEPSTGESVKTIPKIVDYALQERFVFYVYMYPPS